MKTKQTEQVILTQQTKQVEIQVVRQVELIQSTILKLVLLKLKLHQRTRVLERQPVTVQRLHKVSQRQQDVVQNKSCNSP